MTADPPPTRFLIVRHGQTVTNREGRFCGHSETDLTELGRAQAAALGSRLSAAHIDMAVTSDLGRAIETARLALGRRSADGTVPLTQDAALRELHYGEWEMHRERDIAKAHAAQFALMHAEDPAWHPPGGETTAMVRDRMVAALTDLGDHNPGRCILVVSHGTAINCLLAGVLALPLTHVFRIAIANCGLTELHYRDRRFVARRINDSAHLAAVGAAASLGVTSA